LIRDTKGEHKGLEEVKRGGIGKRSGVGKDEGKETAAIGEVAGSKEAKGPTSDDVERVKTSSDDYKERKKSTKGGV